MSVVCMITSAKGGVGKSTICANLGMALAMEGKRVLLIDCDTANRCLDLLMGLENQSIYGISDVLRGYIPIENAVVIHPDCSALSLLAASSDANAAKLLELHLDALLSSLREREQYDFIFMDMPGGVPSLLSTAAGLSDEALVLSSAQTTAVRSAEKTAELLSKAGLSACYLVINALMQGDTLFSLYNSRRKTQTTMTLFSLIDHIALQLMAVIPYDSSIWDKQNNGLLINDRSYRKTPFQAAIQNLSKRLCHKSIPLFTKSCSK